MKAQAFTRKERRFYVEIGKRIVQQRHAKHWTQSQLAKRSKCGRVFLAHCEYGDYRASMTTLTNVADALGVHPAWLVFGVSARHSKP